MNGFPHLIRHFGTQVWCYENMKDVFENPRGYNLGCILGEEFKVSRTFRDGETFKWEEFEFEVKHSPGHTEYQMALHVTLDGQRVAFTGDAFFPNPRNDGTLRHNHPNGYEVLIQFLAELGHPLSPEQVTQGYRWTHYYWSVSPELLEDDHRFRHAEPKVAA